LRTTAEAARAYLWLLGPDGAACNGKTVAL